MHTPRRVRAASALADTNPDADDEGLRDLLIQLIRSDRQVRAAVADIAKDAISKAHARAVLQTPRGGRRG